jgi:hypothetical protein
MLEQKTNKYLSIDDLKPIDELEPKNNIIILYVLCYHINNDYKYPLLQFMLTKIPKYSNIKEHFTLPYITIYNANANANANALQNIALEFVKNSLTNITNETFDITEDMYRGVVFGKDGITPYLLVNITNINSSMFGLYVSNHTTKLFALPSEIINVKKVYDIEIDKDTVHLFTETPQIGLLTNPHTNKYYLLPDIVYTKNNMKMAEFFSIFGNSKTKAYDSCGKYYYFYRDFSNVINDTNDTNVTNDTNGYEEYINRYALFVESNLYLETNDFYLTDKEIENIYTEPCITICYLHKKNSKPDMLVKKYEQFVCLSYCHYLHK